LQKQKNAIGETSNLAQIALSYYYGETDADKKQELADIVCIMSVLAQVAIDNSKRPYQIDIEKELERIRGLEVFDDHRNGKHVKKPLFFKNLKKLDKNKLDDCTCPMNSLGKIVDAKVKDAKRTPNTVPVLDLLHSFDGKANDKQQKKINKYVDDFDKKVKEHYDLAQKNHKKANSEAWIKEMNVLQKNTVNYISTLKMDEKTMEMLIRNALTEKGDNTKDSASAKFRLKLLNCLYQAQIRRFMEVWKTV
jgi:hypothetical protein